MPTWGRDICRGRVYVAPPDTASSSTSAMRAAISAHVPDGGDAAAKVFAIPNDSDVTVASALARADYDALLVEPAGDGEWMLFTRGAARHARAARVTVARPPTPAPRRTVWRAPSAKRHHMVWRPLAFSSRS